MSHPSMTHPSMTLHGVLVHSAYSPFKQMCRDAMLLTHGTSIVRQHMKNKNIIHLGDDCTFMTSLLYWTRYVLWKFPPSPLHTHTYTHTKEKSIQECSDLRIGCLTCCLKHTLTTTTMQKEEKS